MRRPGFTLTVALAIAAVSMAGVLRLRPGGSLEAMMDSRTPAARAMARVAAEFQAADELLVVASTIEETPNQLLAFAHALETHLINSPALSELIAHIEYQPDESLRAYVQNVIVPNGLYYLDDEQFRAVLDRLRAEHMAEQMRRNEELIATPGPAAEQLAKAMLRDPLRLREFVQRPLGAGTASSLFAEGPYVSKDRRSLLIRIAGVRPASDLDFTRQLMSRVRAAAAEAQQGAAVKLEVVYAGSYAIAHWSERHIRRDMISSTVGSVVSLQILFFLGYRRLLSFPLAFVPTAIAILAAFALFGVFRPELTPATAVIGAVLAGLGIDYGIHVVSHYEERRERGEPPGPAACNVIRDIAIPLAGAAGTTILAFLAISFSSMPALRDFSLLGVLGLTGAVIGSITLLPAALALLDRRLTMRWEHARPRLRLDGVIGFVSRRRGLVLTAFMLIWLGAIVIIAQQRNGVIPIDADLASMHPQPNPPLDLHHDLADRFGGGTDSLLVHLRADSPEDLVVLAHRVKGALHNGEARAAGVTGSFSLATVLPDPAVLPQRNPQIAAIDSDRIRNEFQAALNESIFEPSAFEEYAQFLADFLMAGNPPTLELLRAYPQLAASLLPKSFVDGSAGAAESLCVVFLDRPLTDRAARSAAIENIRAALHDLPGATLTGLSVIGYDTEQTVHHDLRRLLLLAGLAVAGVIWLLFRNVIDVLLTLIPTAFGVTCMLAAMHVYGDGLNMINLIGLPLLLGIGVDDGIFIVAIARRHRAERRPAQELAQHFGAGVHAIVMTTATNVLGFGTLAFTSVPAIQSLGRMTGIGVAACLIGTVFILAPILLLRAHRSKPAVGVDGESGRR